MHLVFLCGLLQCEYCQFSPAVAADVCYGCVGLAACPALALPDVLALAAPGAAPPVLTNPATAAKWTAALGCLEAHFRTSCQGA